MNIEGGRPPEGRSAGRASGRSKEVSDLVAAISLLPEVREAKVRELKKAVDSGTYQVDPGKVAECILKEV
jgi:flagellar biosynthesis anti-sigma factor FlgM